MHKQSQQTKKLTTNKKQTKKTTKKSPLKQQKRNKQSIAGRVYPKVLIPAKTNGPDDFLEKAPTPGQFYEDPQGVEPWDLENRGAMGLQPGNNNQWRLMAAVKAKPFPAKVGFTKQDTLYTYARRVYRLEMKHYINGLRDMEEQRIERNFQVATRQANEIRDRKTIYQAWRHRKKMDTQYNRTVRLQKHAAALAAGYARGQENERQRNLQVSRRRQQYIELMMGERRTTWIENPDDIDPSIFREVSHPTGWWPQDDTKQLYANKFDTDDHDIEKYFTTSFPPFTPIRPRPDGVNEWLDVVQNSEVGWRRENDHLMDKVHKVINLDRADDNDDPNEGTIQMPLPPIDAGTPELVSRDHARQGIRSRTFTLHDQMPGEIHGLLRKIGNHAYEANPNPDYKPQFEETLWEEPSNAAAANEQLYNEQTGSGQQQQQQANIPTHRVAF